MVGGGGGRGPHEFTQVIVCWAVGFASNRPTMMSHFEGCRNPSAASEDPIDGSDDEQTPPSGWGRCRPFDDVAAVDI